MTVEQLQLKLDELDKGVLKHGKHVPEEKEFCILEFDAILRGREWGDSPVTLPDLRPINDGTWLNDKSRTKSMLPVMAALWDWSEWPEDKKQKWVCKVVVETVKQIIAYLPSLPVEIKDQCIAVTNISEARAAAFAAANTPCAYAADSAEYAEYAAFYADYNYNVDYNYNYAAANAAYTANAAAYTANANAAAKSASDAVLTTACQIWCNAAETL